MDVALVALALVAGSLIALQGGQNTTLRAVVRAPVGATLISFAVGFVVLCLMIVVRREGIPTSAELRDVPWWGYLGGPCGVVGVCGTILLVPRLGAATTVALSITGQMLMSLVLDSAGWFEVTQRDLTAERAIGAVIVVIGAYLISRRSRMTVAPAAGGSAAGASPGHDEPLAAHAMALLGGLVIGAVLPTQAAINAHLREGLDAPFTASAISFGGGGVILILLVALLPSQRIRISSLRQVPWWAWLGGLGGAVYVASTVVLVPAFGTAVTTALIVSGQNVFSLLIDHFGWVRLPRRHASTIRIAGVIALLIGVVLTELG